MLRITQSRNATKFGGTVAVAFDGEFAASVQTYAGSGTLRYVVTAASPIL
jgi:hypothetical protein